MLVNYIFEFRVLGAAFYFLNFSSIALAQGVRDICPTDTCNGGSDLRWIWVILLAYLGLYIIVGVFSKDSNTRSSAVKVLKICLRGIGYQIGIPVLIYQLAGGYGQGGEYAIISFFMLLLLFVFYLPVSEWVFGEKEDVKTFKD